MKLRLLSFALFIFGLTSCSKPNQSTSDSLLNTIYKLGRKTDSTSTGPQANSAFTMKVNDSLPPLLLTAHHVVSGKGGDQYLQWDEIGPNMKDSWAWSMTDINYNFKIGRNLPIRGAQTLKLDLAAFYLLSDDVPYLKPARQAAAVGDTVCLYTPITHEKKITLRNKGVVIYASDSVTVYELTGFTKNLLGILTGISGSCVLNENNEVVAVDYGGLTIPNDEIRKQMALQYPLLNKLKIRDGRAYGIALPIPLIEKSILQAFKDEH